MSSWAQRGAEKLLTPTPSPHPQAPTQPEAMHCRRLRRRAAGRRQFRRRMLRRTAAAIATVLVTATAVCAAPESASPRRFCRHRRSRRSSRYAPQIFPRCRRWRGHRRPCHRGHRPCCCDRSGSRIPAAAGVGRAPGAGRPGERKKRHVTVISRAHCGLRTPSLVRWNCKSKVA